MSHAPDALPTIALRPVRAEDDALLRRIYASTRLDELAPLGWSQGQLDAFLRMQFDSQRADYWRNCDTTRFCVISCEGAVAGRLYVEARRDELRIVDIALLPEYRGRGIGSFLIGQLFAEADAAGVAVRIHVEHANPAQQLYLRLGFAFRGESDGLYRLMERKTATFAYA